MQRFHVVAFPEMAAEDSATLEALRATHDPEGQRNLGAHFTLVFGCDCVSQEIMEDAMRSVAASFKTFEFYLARALLSEHDDLHYVFLCPQEGANEFLELHKSLHAGPLACCLDVGRTFEPHMTICKTADPQQARELHDHLERVLLRIRGRVHALSMGFLSEGGFKVIAQASLVRDDSPTGRIGQGPAE
jgi:2'-5' RNA ligase